MDYLLICVLLYVESKVWQKAKVDGDMLIGRGAHTLVSVDGHVVLYGGSAEFQRNLGHCTQYFNDVYIMKTGEQQMHYFPYRIYSHISRQFLAQF